VRGAAAAPFASADGVSSVVASLARSSSAATILATSDPCHPRLRHGNGKTIHSFGPPVLPRRQLQLFVGSRTKGKGRGRHDRLDGRRSRPTRRSKSFQAKPIVWPLAVRGGAHPLVDGRSSKRDTDPCRTIPQRNGRSLSPRGSGVSIGLGVCSSIRLLIVGAAFSLSRRARDGTNYEIVVVKVSGNARRFRSRRDRYAVALTDKYAVSEKMAGTER
jgi:hypothetical protein